MLEGLATWVLNNYLGKYVENLNTDQLSIALLSGEVELENLPLKKDAFRHLGLSIEVKAGIIGKIKLQIPLRQIRSAPWLIVIEQLYVVAGPISIDDWSAEAEAQARQEIKLTVLDALEAKWRVEHDTKTNNITSSSSSSWLSFGTGILTDIVENLQLIIKNVHVRYEDRSSVPGKTIACGITMESLSAQSCDSSWNPGFVHWENFGQSFKVMELQKLSLYWDNIRSDSEGARADSEDLLQMLRENRNNHEYIMAPVSAKAHVTRDRCDQPLKSASTPRFVCDLQLEEVPLNLKDWQYEQAVVCYRSLDQVDKLRSSRSRRPACRVSDSPRTWWLYACRCAVGSATRVFDPGVITTWESCLDRARANVRYAKLYTRCLVCPSAGLTFEEKEFKEIFERDRELDELRALRECSMRLVPPSDSTKEPSSRGVLLQWFPQWWNWYSSSQPDPSTEQLEGEFLEALEGGGVDEDELMRRDAVFGRFSFYLRSGVFTIYSTGADSGAGSIPMLELKFDNLNLSFESRLRSDSLVVELSLGALYLNDKLTEGSLFPVLVGPPGPERGPTTGRGWAKTVSPRFSKINEERPLFQLRYESNPPNVTADHSLQITSQSLDVVYQPAVAKWLVDFLCNPYQRSVAQMKIEDMKNRTKNELMKNWRNIINGKLAERKSWDLHFDISTPQIIFVEQFHDQNAIIAVVDFGRLLLSNSQSSDVQARPELIPKESEEDDMFMTPCCTPPGSEASDSDTEGPTITIDSQAECNLNERSLHHKLYDRYTLKFTDLQVLVGRVRDNWQYAHTKGTSSLHVLDRFDIILQIERRIIQTCDPLFPSLTFDATLPKLVAHINEPKLLAIRTLGHTFDSAHMPSPFTSQSDSDAESPSPDESSDEDSVSVDRSAELSRMIILQFCVEYLAVDVQSRGRSVAELQVTGVHTMFMKRPNDISVSLTVHGLLLVDALQTFGHDFELLIASHKHVGMDSISGSLRDSEPTSPTSPGSPEPLVNRHKDTSAADLNQVFTHLSSLPGVSRPLDLEALITVEIFIVLGAEPIQNAHLRFNNLDIIANQETIVELIGFVKRVFPHMKSKKAPTCDRFVKEPGYRSSNDSILKPTMDVIKTDITFNFHRLNILLLRGLNCDGIAIGRKIATATMAEAKIEASFGETIEIEGSLGGLQVLDLTPEGQIHQRVFSVGKDPLMNTSHFDSMYVMGQSWQESCENKAFSFTVKKTEETKVAESSCDIKMRMGSVWYVYVPQFLKELKSCINEFQQYLSNLARSIKTAATDMALGLVHARTETLAQSLSMNSRMTASFYGGALSWMDLTSPKKRRKSNSESVESLSYMGHSYRTPYSPFDDDDFKLKIKLDIVLNSPVLVIPRSRCSLEVFVAHLGKISVTNLAPKEKEFIDDAMESRFETYDVEIRNINLFSLDITSRRQPGPTGKQPEKLYNCDTLAKPILHDTIVKLKFDREIFVKNGKSQAASCPNLLLGDEESPSLKENSTPAESLEIVGRVVKPLKVSLTRSQYEQLLDTVDWLTATSAGAESSIAGSRDKLQTANPLEDITEEDSGVSTLSLDPRIRAKLFPTITEKSKSKESRIMFLKVLFELPVLTVQLIGTCRDSSQGLADLSFTDFIVNYEKTTLHESSIQMSLRSLVMEDLCKAENSIHRCLVVSSRMEEAPTLRTCLSTSCPDMTRPNDFSNVPQYSLPDNYASNLPTEVTVSQNLEYPNTPPPSPHSSNSPNFRQRSVDNLVLISILLADQSAPNFQSHYKSMGKSMHVDFNSLDLVISVESWVAILDFFNVQSRPETKEYDRSDSASTKSLSSDNSQFSNSESFIAVKSLNLVLVRDNSSVARATISGFDIRTKTLLRRKEYSGTLGSLLLLDITPDGSLYRERFSTSGKKALTFHFESYENGGMKDYDAKLKLEMSSVSYVHTKRFLAEIQSFYHNFELLRLKMDEMRLASQGSKVLHAKPTRVKLDIEAGAPLLFIPVSSKSKDILVADLGNLKITNTFKVIDSMNNFMVDAMVVDLLNMDVYCAQKKNLELQHGVQCVKKVGPSLLTQKCHLQLNVERKMFSEPFKGVPDFSIKGKLIKLEGTLNLLQYRLIRSLLSHNLGEYTEDILPSVPHRDLKNSNELWTLNSLQIDLSNVIVHLQHSESSSSSLSCINFIKSRLVVENFSNHSQDVDLVSQEILITDTRYDEAAEGNQPNIFTNILQPIKNTSSEGKVVAEIHSRTRQEYSKFTVLLNSMRLLAILDWWETIRDFIFEDDPNFPSPPKEDSGNKNRDNSPFELRVNITESEVVFVENTTQRDTNSVILKSTTVITYNPNNADKILSCNLSKCEVFACMFGDEEDTALSIIDPVTVNMDLDRNGLLEVQVVHLTVRLSYHDMKMFLQICNSLPKQTSSARKNSGELPLKNFQANRLVTLGFDVEDCVAALEKCENRLDDAALWLTQHAVPVKHKPANDKLSFEKLEVKAESFDVCIIDDCGDADVPLLELTLASMHLKQDLQQNTNVSNGSLGCYLSSDYYNRALSGWEPVLEPWQCKVTWTKGLSADYLRSRLQVSVSSEGLLNFNLTSAFMELCRGVHENWTKDYYQSGPARSLAARFRKPFVPFAIKNNTGTPLRFSTAIASLEDFYEMDPGRKREPDESWVNVLPGQTLPFSFENRGKIRHGDTHKLKIHQLLVQAEGWRSITPLSIDRVGVFFRNIMADSKGESGLPPARLIFEVMLEGSARKLVTVRSPLLLMNKLQEDIDIKLESHPAAVYRSSELLSLHKDESISIPLYHINSQISARPSSSKHSPFCNPAVDWRQVSRPGEVQYSLHTCYFLRGSDYKFCVETRCDRSPSDELSQSKFLHYPAHTITLLPSVLIVNLLPQELYYNLLGVQGRVARGSESAISNVNIENGAEVVFHIENLTGTSPLMIPSITTRFKCRVRLEDKSGRRLNLHADIIPNSDAKLKIIITSPFWIINKTGMALVFRQEGVSTETAGQFSEHEVARMVAPLLFSFSDPDASTTVVCRVGSAVVPNGQPYWCQHFHLQGGVQVRKLHVMQRDKPDAVFIIGVEVRRGRGRYRNTHIVTLSPRFQIFNKSSFELEFSQACYASQLSELGAQSTYLRIVSNAHIPYHWPRLDKDQLLCVRIRDVPDCGWSGGLIIDKNHSLHVNIRNSIGRMYFLRLEVILQTATFYIIFTDAVTMPPPIRVDNFSEVSVEFAQFCCAIGITSTVRAHVSVPYAWDEPTQPHCLTVVAPGGTSHTYEMAKIGPQAGLTYENFIYIAFTVTFKNSNQMLDPFDVKSQQLVLDVNSDQRIVLARKQPGKRSQLWRMTSSGQLQHEGSSPPQPPHQARSHMLVLDIAGTAPQPFAYSRLALKQPDQRRSCTQTWTFTEDGRLCCGHRNMCVQAKDGFFGIRSGNDVVLGMYRPTNNSEVPLEQCVGQQKMRPGSGYLSVEITTDGPTKVLNIRDKKSDSEESCDWNPAQNLEGSEDKKDETELQITVRLENGLGVSLVASEPPEELMYARFSSIVTELVMTAKAVSFCLSVLDVQWDNQLLDAVSPVVLNTVKTASRSHDEAVSQNMLPALQLRIELQSNNNPNLVNCKHFIITLKPISVHLEEKWLLKLLAFVGYNPVDDEQSHVDESDFETQRMLTEVSAAHSKRYYFDVLKLAPSQARLSVVTTAKLSRHLSAIKRKLGLTLIKFEDAPIDMQPFMRIHCFETGECLANWILKHFKDELKWQAAMILGSVDFLGNPLGFVNDVSEGVSGLIYEGSVKSLVKNVTHGISNSAAKVTESLSDGLGRVTMDDEHEEMRQKIRQVRPGRSGDHLVAGIKGLGFGILGGATGIFKQVYEGAANEGIQGVFSGLGKGMLGAVTKPMVGVLDLASETARAIRDSSRSGNRLVPERRRLPRCAIGPRGLLPPYDEKQSAGQDHLYSVNSRDYAEQFVAYEWLRSGAEDLRALVSSQRVRIVTSASSGLATVIEAPLRDLQYCQHIGESEAGEVRHYVELCCRIRAPAAGSMPMLADTVKRPRVRCDTLELAQWLCQQVNFAKRVHDEHLHTVLSEQASSATAD